MYNGLSDEQIVALAKNGDSKAEEYIFTKYKNFVRAKCRSFFLAGAETEDVIQEGMIGLLRAVRDFDNSKNNSFQAFAAMCIRRQLISAFKGAARKKHIPLNSYVSLNKPFYDGDSERTLMDVLTSEYELDPEQLFITGENKSYIAQKIEKDLSGLEKNVLKMYLQGLSYHEISQELGCSEKCVDNALQRVKRKLSHNKL